MTNENDNKQYSDKEAIAQATKLINQIETLYPNATQAATVFNSVGLSIDVSTVMIHSILLKNNAFTNESNVVACLDCLLLGILLAQASKKEVVQ